MERIVAGLMIFLVSAMAAGAGGIPDLFQAGEENIWVLEQGGKQVGIHGFRYEGTLDVPGGKVHRFTARARMPASGAVPVEQKYQAELWTDDDGHPLRHVLQVLLGDAYSGVSMVVADGRAEVEINQGGTIKPMQVDVAPEAYIQTNNFIGYFDLMLGLNPVEPDGQLELSLFSSNVLRPIPYQANYKEAFTEQIDGTTVSGYKITDSLGETIWIDSDGRMLRLEVSAANLVVRRSDQPMEPFTIEAPSTAEIDDSLDREEVEITHGAVTLAGTITRPRGSEGKLPSVFFVSGSGSQDRQGNSSGIDTGTHEILDHLTRAGFMVLRVDDRGVGGSRGPTTGVGYQDLVADARAAVNYLAARDDADAARIVVIGHSEGGLTALILGNERPDLGAVVLMASVGRPMIEIIIGQNRDALEQSGVNGESLEAQLAELRRQFDLISGDTKIDPQTLPAEFQTLMANRKWFQDHAAEDPAERAGKVRAPLLILHGAKDFQVSPDQDARRILAALEAAEHADHTLRVFDELDHLFKKTEGDTSSLAEYFKKRPIDPEFLQVLTEWLTERLLVAEVD